MSDDRRSFQFFPDEGNEVPPEPTQPPRLYDVAASKAAREQAIHRVDAAAEPDWKECAYEAVRLAALEKPYGFTTDDVWPRIPAGVDPHEPRAMGAVMRRAERAGLIIRADGFRPTALIAAHRRPKQIWLAVAKPL